MAMDYRSDNSFDASLAKSRGACDNKRPMFLTVNTLFFSSAGLN